MVLIKIYDYEKIDTVSNELRKMVSDSISKHILKNWDDCVEEEYDEFNDEYEVTFKICL